MTTEKAPSSTSVDSIVRRLCRVAAEVFGLFLVFASGFGFGTMQSHLSSHYENLPVWMGFACALSGWLLVRSRASI